MSPDASSPEWPKYQSELRALLGQGRKIEAVKRYREITGAGLAQAKDAVEAIERGEIPATAPSELGPELLALIREGRKIEAIKHYRERTGAGLVEAKDAVEAIERGETAAVAESELGPELVALLRENQKIEAIKRYREATGVGLKQAKDAVEALALQHGIATQGGGCAGVVVVALLVGGLLTVVKWLT